MVAIRWQFIPQIKALKNRLGTREYITYIMAGKAKLAKTIERTYFIAPSVRVLSRRAFY
jgi:hypothetical protein